LTRPALLVKSNTRSWPMTLPSWVTVPSREIWMGLEGVRVRAAPLVPVTAYPSDVTSLPSAAS
jgi:hypothetical protein